MSIVEVAPTIEERIEAVKANPLGCPIHDLQEFLLTLDQPTKVIGFLEEAGFSDITRMKLKVDTGNMAYMYRPSRNWITMREDGKGQFTHEFEWFDRNWYIDTLIRSEKLSYGDDIDQITNQQLFEMQMRG